MSNTPRLTVANNITSSTVVYNAAAAAVVTSLIICSKAGVDTTVNVFVTDSSAAVTVSLLSGTPLPTGDSITPLSTNNRLALEVGDSITVSAANAVDVIVSSMEVT